MPFSLHTQPVLILDCQTTGMHPKNAHLLEVAWCVFDPKHPADMSVHSYLIKLPDLQTVPSRIQEMTGISNDDLADALSLPEVFQKLQETIYSLGHTPLAIAHYAQFETSFLKDMYYQVLGEAKLNFEIHCTQKIVKILFTDLPSYNIKAASSMGNCSYIEFKRASSHVVATVEIWKAILNKLEKLNITDLPSLYQKTFQINNNPAKKLSSIDRLTRLDLPALPGIYRFVTHDNKILYIGKATSLKTRVNSYFTGQIKHDKKKREMITQVRDIQTIVCATPLEAALLEIDEIEKYKPYYNTIFNNSKRSLLFYDKNFASTSIKQSDECNIGPFKQFDAIHQLCELHRWLRDGITSSLFDPEFSIHFAEGFIVACEKNHLNPLSVKSFSIRQMLAIGFKALRQLEKIKPKKPIEKFFDIQKKLEEEQDASYFEKIASRLERIVIRSAYAKRRCHQLTRLLNATVILNKKNKTTLHFCNGKPHSQHYRSAQKLRWANLTIKEADKMAVLLTAINKHNLEIIID